MIGSHDFPFRSNDVDWLSLLDPFAGRGMSSHDTLSLLRHSSMHMHIIGQNRVDKPPAVLITSLLLGLSLSGQSSTVRRPVSCSCIVKLSARLLLWLCMQKATVSSAQAR